MPAAPARTGAAARAAAVRWRCSQRRTRTVASVARQTIRMTRWTVSTASAIDGSSATISTLSVTARRRRTRSSGTAATGTRAGSSRAPARRSGRGPACSCRRASGKPASRKASGSSHRSPSQIPAVSGTGSGQRRSDCDDEPDQPDHEHQRADVVLRPARPGHAAAGHERPADEQEQQRLQRQPFVDRQHDRDHAGGRTRARSASAAGASGARTRAAAWAWRAGWPWRDSTRVRVAR